MAVFEKARKQSFSSRKAIGVMIGSLLRGPSLPHGLCWYRLMRRMVALRIKDQAGIFVREQKELSEL